MYFYNDFEAVTIYNFDFNDFVYCQREFTSYFTVLFQACSKLVPSLFKACPSALRAWSKLVPARSQSSSTSKQHKQAARASRTSKIWPRRLHHPRRRRRCPRKKRNCSTSASSLARASVPTGATANCETAKLSSAAWWRALNNITFIMRISTGAWTSGSV